MAKKATLTQISQAAGVSIATVSRVLSGKDPVAHSTRQRVLHAIRDLEFDAGLQPTIPVGGAILALIPDFSNPFYAGIIEGIQQTARASGYEILLTPTADTYTSAPALAAMIRREGFSGVLWLSSTPGSDLLNTVGRSVPMVMVGEYPEDYPVSYVSVDDVNAAYRAVNHLISTGCRRIGMVNCSGRYKYARHRAEGYRRALADAGLPFVSDQYTSIPTIDYTLAYSAALQVLHTEPPPDAIFTSSDVLAAAVINAATSMGLRIPEDLSVIGFDNVLTSRITHPSITTIAQPSLQLGQQACSILIEKIQTPSLPERHILLNTELIIRESTR